MTLRYYLAGVELTNVNVTGRPRQGALDGLVSSAYSGDIGSSGIIIDDPLGAVTIKGLQRFHVVEDACTPSRIWTGYIAGRRISRSDMGHNAAGRVWDCDLQDLNMLLGARLVRRKRVAETDVQRIQWLLTTTAMTAAGDTTIYDNGLVLTASPHPYDEADYTKSRPAEVISSVMGLTKIGFLYWDDSAGQVSLFYGKHATAMGDLTVKLSNNPADIDDTATPQTVFAAHEGQQVNRSPEDIADGLYFDWRGTDIYRQRAATFTDFGFHRDAIYSTERVGSPVTASNQTDSQLLARSVERDTIVCTVRLKASQVNWFREGFRVQVKFTHLPGYESFVWVTILRRTVRQGASSGWYDVELEMTTVAPESGPGGGDPGVFPYQPNCGLGFVQYALNTGTSVGSLTLPAAPTVGNTLVYLFAGRTTSIGSNPPATGTWTLIDEVDQGVAGGATCGLYYKIVDASDTAVWTLALATADRALMVEFSGSMAFDTSAKRLVAPTNEATVSITPTAAKKTLLVSAVTTNFNSGLPSPYTLDPVSGMTLVYGGSTVQSPQPPSIGVNFRVVDVTSGSYTVGSTGSAQGFENMNLVAAAFMCDASGNPPSPATWVGISPPEYVVMSGVNGTTVFPFADGSLRVFYDNIDQTAAIVSYDGAAGTFVMAGAPLTGWQVRVEYQGR